MTSEPPAFRPSRHQREVVVADWRDAEELAAWHMTTVLGMEDARLTAAGPDGGVDVVAPKAVAQVKHYGGQVGAPEVQQLRGAGFSKDHALFYALSGYTTVAQVAADNSGVALFTYNVYGDVSPTNRPAQALQNLNPRVASPRGSSPSEQRARVENDYADLKHLVRTDPVAAAMPPRGAEEALSRISYEALAGDLRIAAAEQFFTLRAYDFEEGPSEDLRWYHAAGGPPELPELHSETAELAEDLSTRGHVKRWETRSRLIGDVERASQDTRRLLEAWRQMRELLPGDKRGAIDWERD